MSVSSVIYAVFIVSMILVLPQSWLCHIQCHVIWDHVIMEPGPWSNIKMSHYQYRKSHCGHKTDVRSSYLHNVISYTGKMASLYWISSQIVMMWPKYIHTLWQVLDWQLSCNILWYQKHSITKYQYKQTVQYLSQEIDRCVWWEFEIGFILYSTLLRVKSQNN